MSESRDHSHGELPNSLFERFCAAGNDERATHDDDRVLPFPSRAAPRLHVQGDGLRTIRNTDAVEDLLGLMSGAVEALHPSDQRTTIALATMIWLSDACDGSALQAIALFSAVAACFGEEPDGDCPGGGSELPEAA